jgi:hypothetical protein
LSKDWGLLPPLLKAISDCDKATFASALDAYLAKGWGPPAEKLAKYALKETTPRYCGKWCFLSAAVCSIMDFMPELSKKALQYVPVDLIQRRVSG